MKSRSFVFQTLSTLGFQQSGIVLTLAVGVITARFLGAEGKGFLAMIAAPVAIICAFGEFGVRQSVAFLIGKETFDQREIQSNVLAIFLFVGCLAFLATILAYLLFGLLVENSTISLVYALITPMILLRRFAGGILLGKQQIHRLNSVDLADRATVFFAMLVGFLLIGNHLEIAVAATVLGALVSTILVLCYIAGSGSMVPRWNTGIALVILRRGIVYALSLFFITSASKAGVLLTGIYATTSEVGIYSVGVSISELVRQLPLAAGLVLLSRSIVWREEQASRKLQDVCVLTRTILPLALGFGIVLTIASSYLVPRIYGSEFSNAFIVTALQAPAEALLAVVLLLHFFASGQGRPMLAASAFATALLVTVVLGSFLIPRMGYIGTSLAADCGYIVGSILYLARFSGKFSVPIRDLILLRPSDIQFLLAKLR